MIMSCDGNPYYVQKKIIKRLENRKNTRNNDTLELESIPAIFCRITYAVVQGEALIKNLVRKLKRHVDTPKEVARLKKKRQWDTEGKVQSFTIEIIRWGEDCWYLQWHYWNFRGSRQWETVNIN